MIKRDCEYKEYNMNTKMKKMYTYMTIATDSNNLTLDYNLLYLGDNCIQVFHLGRYIVGYTVENFVLRQRDSRAVKCNS